MIVLTVFAETTDQETGMQTVVLLQVREVSIPAQHQVAKCLTAPAFPLTDSRDTLVLRPSARSFSAMISNVDRVL